MTNDKLPQGWVECQLKDIAIVKGGKRLPAGAQYAESMTKYPYIRVTNFENMTVNTNDLKYLTPEVQNKIKNYTISKDDIYISIAGSIGKVGIIPDELDGANLTENAAKIIHPINKKFLTYILNSLEIQNQISAYTKSTTQPKLALYRIEELKIKFPPLNEQRRIVEKIESEFKKIDEGLEYLLITKDKIKQYRQSVLKSAFEGKLTQQNPGDEPAEILLQKINPKANCLHNDKLPQGWVECQLGQVFKIVNGDRGKNYPAKNKLHTSGIPFVSAINIQNSELSVENLLCLNEQQYDLLRSGKINKGDTLLCIRGSIGKHCIYQLDKGAIASSMVIIRQIAPSIDKFLFYYLESFCFRQEVKKYDNGTAQPNLSATDLKKFNYPLPPLNEQRRIVEEIETRFALADKVEKVVDDNIKQAKQLKQSILKKAFEGRLVPQDPTDEPASVLLEKIKKEKNNDRK